MTEKNSDRTRAQWRLTEGERLPRSGDTTREMKKASLVKKILLGYLGTFILILIISEIPGLIRISSFSENPPLYFAQELIHAVARLYLGWILPPFILLAYLLTAPVPHRRRWLILWVTCFGVNLLVIIYVHEILEFARIPGLTWVRGGNYVTFLIAALYLWAFNHSPRGRSGEDMGGNMFGLAPEGRLAITWFVFKVALALSALVMLATSWFSIEFLDPLWIWMCLCSIIHHENWWISVIFVCAVIIGTGIPVHAILKRWAEPRIRSGKWAARRWPAQTRIRIAWSLVALAAGAGLIIIVRYVCDAEDLWWMFGDLVLLTGGILPLVFFLYKFHRSIRDLP